MKEYYYCVDGQTVEGPHSEGELHEMLQGGALKPETLVCPAGEKDWVPLSGVSLAPAPVVAKAEPAVAPPPSGAVTTVDHQAIAAAGNDKDEEEEEEDRGLSKHQLLRAIRADLDLLWKAQRESLISHVRGLELDPQYETTRKQAAMIRYRVREATLQYWRKSRTFEKWIDALVWKDCDLVRKLRGATYEEKHQDAKQWLTKAKLWDEAGCYCFRAGKEYFYIGRTESLGIRLTQHRDKNPERFEKATHLRIIIPSHKAWISKLEKLLWLNHPDTKEAKVTPSMGSNNPADEILELLDKEMSDLLVDG